MQLIPFRSQYRAQSKDDEKCVDVGTIHPILNSRNKSMEPLSAEIRESIVRTSLHYLLAETEYLVESGKQKPLITRDLRSFDVPNGFNQSFGQFLCVNLASSTDVIEVVIFNHKAIGQS